MPRNTHKNRTKLINNKRTNKQIGTLKKRRINKKRGGETKFSSFADVVEAATDDAKNTATEVKTGLNKVTENTTDKVNNFIGDTKIKAEMASNVVGDSTTSTNNTGTIKQKLSDAFKVTSESQSEKVSDKEIITAVLDKYLNLLKEEKIKESEFVIKFLLDNDKKKDLINEMITDKASYKPLWTQIGESTKETLTQIGESTKETLTQIQKNPLNINIQRELDKILYEFKEAEDIVNEITYLLKQPSIEKKLKKKQIEQINQIIKNQPGMLSNVSKNIAAGFEQFGSWLIPTVTTDASGNPIKEHNETNIHFLWYPRMHTKYRKGQSASEKINRYGDFMVYVEPEKYSSTAEFIVQSADSVDDLLTNVLNGYDKSAVPQPYKHKIYTIKNYQPFFNKPTNIT